jgi:hypothetical protein
VVAVAVGGALVSDPLGVPGDAAEKSSDQTADWPDIGEPPLPEDDVVEVVVALLTVSWCDGRLCQAPPDPCQKPKTV